MATTTPLPASLIEGAGLPRDEVAEWAAMAPVGDADFDTQWRGSGEFLRRGEQLLARLPPRADSSDGEQRAAVAIADAQNDARERFLRAHAEELYGVLTEDFTRPLRDEQLLFEAAERFPGLTPDREAMATELARPLAEKQGIEIAQGLFLAHILSSPRAGAHLLHSMMRPTPEGSQRLEQFRAEGAADLGAVRVSRRGRAGILELRNPRHLNAEDETTLAATECGVDLILLDPEIEVGVIRGGPVDHPRYAGARILGSGLNLTRLYRGSLPYLFFITRDLGYVNKIYRGLAGPEFHPAEPEETTEKLWIAAAETYAIGGACQLLHVMDHVIAARGCRLYLPARREGIIPGASNLRLSRSVGDRMARQAIVSGLEFEAGTPPAQMICDEVVEAEAVDAAIEARIEVLTSSGLVNAAANRRALRVGGEPLDVFRRYMATYAREQAHCYLSPALVRNLEEHWNAHERGI
jgi:thioesterase DpgC